MAGMRWRDTHGRDLSPLPDEPYPWKRIVAVLNIWNDAPDLRRNVDSWSNYVDECVILDGAYSGIEVAEHSSTDSPEVELGHIPWCKVPPPKGGWPDQCAKRSAMFDHTEEGDLIVLIDADEAWYGLEALRDAPFMDVGWVQYTSPIYSRAQHQHRVFRWMPDMAYKGRHHWIYQGDKVVATGQQGGPGYLHRNLDGIGFHNSRGQHRPAERRRLAGAHREKQHREEMKVGTTAVGHEPLRIWQAGPIDPGATIYRLHSAINSTTPHMSAMATEVQEWLEEPRQFRLGTDRPFSQLAAAADVVHLHVSDLGLKYVNDPNSKAVVMHHHGTDFRLQPEKWNRKDRERDALRLVSNLELLQYGENLHWLPNPIPVEQYAALAGPRLSLDLIRDQGPLRVCHSPSKRAIKGTEEFLEACKKLKGLVEPVLIEHTSHAECLKIKATCHACFDSFDLGIQNSGLEAAAMGMPVIAGDQDVADAYRSMTSPPLPGVIPYTFTLTDVRTLAATMEALATDEVMYRKEAAFAHQFVTEYHDYGAVTARYLALLEDKFGWRRKLKMGDPQLLGRPVIV